MANIGVHGHPATLHLETLWIKNVTITTGLVDTHSTPRLLKLVSEGRLDPQTMRGVRELTVSSALEFDQLIV